MTQVHRTIILKDPHILLTCLDLIFYVLIYYIIFNYYNISIDLML